MDLPFLMLVVLLTGIGVIMMFSASYASSYYTMDDPTYFFVRQGVFAVGGVAVMYITSKMSYQRLRWMSVFILAAAFALLILVKVPGIGVTVKGANRWIRGFGPIPQFQPSEVAKIGIILYFSARLSKRSTEKKKKYDTRTMKGTFLSLMDRIGLIELLPYAAVLLVTAGLLLLEPHMSATILIFAVGAAILFAAGVKLGWFAAGGAAVGAALWFIINNTDYMQSRIELWQNPWSDPQGGGFQAIQSLYAIGSGGLFGLGLGQSRQKFLYLPEPQNDFVFSIVCEELGYIGAAIVLILFALLILRGYWLALHARDRFGALVVVGITTQLAVQVFLNIGVVTNLFPVTGISLPFFSYGGTALLIQLFEMGIILSVSRQIPAPRAG
ncbi:MAG: putative lipid II flippase FtsW [Clostridia bacterium]|nr:putative lipid II flippase FtsW [Clostridia bacterium]